ncbi:hypothetical protein D8I35_08395 [Corticibacter populi]|uniref:Uncharacterized protein n=1 Tax=Corticibacter populi TaxID=1550736 RepID=A0A3M6QUH8_9BURK|nr:hypothetical protein D8I35_08395 [Corticibacter populi]
MPPALHECPDGVHAQRQARGPQQVGPAVPEITQQIIAERQQGQEVAPEQTPPAITPHGHPNHMHEPERGRHRHRSARQRLFRGLRAAGLATQLQSPRVSILVIHHGVVLLPVIEKEGTMATVPRDTVPKDD